MYTSNRTPTRILPRRALDVLEAIEQELDVPILLANIRSTGSPGRARQQVEGAWSLVEARSGVIDHAIKDRAIAIVVGATESGAEWSYQEGIPAQWFLDDPPDRTYFPGGEYLRLTDSGETVIDLGGLRYCDVSERLVGLSICFGSAAWNSWHDLLDWSTIIGDPVRLAADPEFAAIAEARRQEREEAAFAAYMTQNRSRVLTQARQRLEQNERSVSTYTEELSRFMTACRESALEIAGIESRMSGDIAEADWRQKWNAIINHARITKINLDFDTLKLVTDDIFMAHPNSGETRWLGRFEISISPIAGCIRMRNLDNPKGGRDHPHVPNGTPCWGNASSMVSQLISNSELYALVDLCLMFLTTFNLADDWGAYASYWFGAEDETPDRLKPESERTGDPELVQPEQPVMGFADLVNYNAAAFNDETTGGMDI